MGSVLEASPSHPARSRPAGSWPSLAWPGQAESPEERGATVPTRGGLAPWGPLSPSTPRTPGREPLATHPLPSAASLPGAPTWAAGMRALPRAQPGAGAGPEPIPAGPGGQRGWGPAAAGAAGDRRRGSDSSPTARMQPSPRPPHPRAGQRRPREPASERRRRRGGRSPGRRRPRPGLHGRRAPAERGRRGAGAAGATAAEL